MDWDDLRTFLAIARAGTLSAAARDLGLTQPTMGRRLAALERRSGARLLQRLPGGYALTPLGESVLAHAERIEVEALAAQRAIAGRDVALAGTVRVTTVDVLASEVLVPAIAALRREHPGIMVEVVPDSRLLSLSKREADLALRPSRFASQEIHARRVGMMRLAVFGARRADGRPADAEPRLVTVLDDQAHLPEATLLREMYPDAPIALRSNSREVLLRAVLAGIGLAVLPVHYGDRVPGLERVDPQHRHPDLDRDLWLGVHADMRRMPRIRAVIDAIVAELARQNSVTAA